jgi:hypothetical protein
VSALDEMVLAHIEALKADKARLEWLVSSGELSGLRVWSDDRWTFDDNLGSHATWRAAIDAAMAVKP